MKKILFRSLRIIILFIFLYDPPFYKISILFHAIFLYSLVNVIRLSKNNKIKLVTDIKKLNIIPFITCLFAISVYLFIYDIISRTANVAYGRIYIYMVIAIEIVVISYNIALVYSTYNLDEFLEDILIAGNIQAIIGIAMFMMPELKNILVHIMFNNGVDQIASYLLDVRFFGFSHYLTSTTPILQTVLAILACWLFLEKSYKYICYVPFLLFSAFVNSRTSLIIVGIGIVLILLYNLNNKKVLLRIFTIAIMFVALTILILPNIIDTGTFEWIKSGIDEIIAFFHGKDIGYFDYLKNSIFFPENKIQLLFGTGHSIFTGAVKNSDVGFVNDIWMIGLLLSSCLYVTYIFFILNNYKNVGKTGKMFRVYFLFTCILFNIKGIAIGNNEIIRWTILYLSVETMNTNKNEDDKFINRI